MRRRVRLVSIVLVLFALVLTGCTIAQRAVEEAVSEVAEEATSITEPTSSKGGKGSETTSQPTAAPEQEDEPAGEQPVEEGAIAPDEVTAFDKLDSYRMTQVMQWETESDEGSEQGEVSWEVAYVRDPAAMQWRMTGREGPDASDETSMEMIQVEGVTYINYGDGWMAITNEEEIVDPWTYSPDDYVFGDSQRVGTETVNGYHCVHYRAPDTEALLGVGRVTEADYWVSTKYDIVVRGIVGWEVSSGDDESGEWHMQWDITEINEPINIVAPEGVAKPGLPDDVPLMAEASNVSSMMGITSFEIDATAEEVANYYLEALENNGWTHGDSPLPTMHSFSKDGRDLTLIIDDESTPTSVTIMIAEE
ncbi:MAG: hypothetical protein J7M15_02610 [Anaerolineae bacterium]|nr:hypothetical protein [Anaerolineae bacterium]